MNRLDVRAHALRDALVGQAVVGSRNVTYYLGEVIAQGNQGYIYSARWGDPGGFAVVVKVLRPDTVAREALLRFEREAAVLRMLAEGQTPNLHIVRIFDNGSHDVTVDGSVTTMPFTVLEHVRGDSLDHILRATAKRGMPVSRVLRVTEHVASALAHVHQHGVVHRDLKPSNILLTPTEEGEVAKVTDFGLAKLVHVTLASTSELAGASLGYAPPEQYEQGNERVTARSDVFSLAAILFEMLSGHPAFPYGADENALVIVTRLAKGPRPELRKHIDSLPYELRTRKDDVAALDRIFQKAFRSDPEGRHESVKAFAAEVVAVLRPIVAEGALVSKKGFTGRAIGANMPLSSPNPTPSNTWGFRVSAAHAPPGSIRAAYFDPSGQRAMATSVGGLLHWEEDRWRVIRWPRQIDGKCVRGLAPLAGGDLLVFGEKALVHRWSPSGELTSLSTTDRAVTFTSARAFGDRITLVGYRGVPNATDGTTEAVGVLLEIEGTTPRYMFDLPGTTRLRDVTHVSDGTAILVGDWGALVRVKDGHVLSTSSVCGGHLNAALAVSDQTVVVVGAGGHALTIPSVGTPVLEAVETTKDLRTVTKSPEGLVFAAGKSSRILARRGGRWVRVPFQMDEERTIIALFSDDSVLRALCDDGTILEGTRYG